MKSNLTQHVLTPEQLTDGIQPLAADAFEQVKSLLTFETIESLAEAPERATKLAEIAKNEGATAVMIGGAPFFMSILEQALRAAGVVPTYAFTTREAVDLPQADGSVKKTQVFKHRGLVVAGTLEAYK